jgi:hypothetical protein
MEYKTKIKTTPTSIYQQPLENNRKIKTALTTNNQWKTKQKLGYRICLFLRLFLFDCGTILTV